MVIGTSFDYRPLIFEVEVLNTPKVSIIANVTYLFMPVEISFGTIWRWLDTRALFDAELSSFTVKPYFCFFVMLLGTV